jgi:hypothetical protein
MRQVVVQTVKPPLLGTVVPRFGSYLDTTLLQDGDFTLMWIASGMPTTPHHSWKAGFEQLRNHSAIR